MKEYTLDINIRIKEMRISNNKKKRMEFFLKRMIVGKISFFSG